MEARKMNSENKPDSSKSNDKPVLRKPEREVKLPGKDFRPSDHATEAIEQGKLTPEDPGLPTEEQS